MKTALVVLVILAAVGPAFAVDLTVENATVTGNLVVGGSINKIQAGRFQNQDGNNTGGNWMRVTFVPAFADVPVLVATGVRDSGTASASPFVVSVKNLDATGVTLRALNLNNTAHRQKLDWIHWMAYLP